MLWLRCWNKTTWLEVRERSCFGLRYLVLSPQNAAGNCLEVYLKTSSGVTLTNVKTPSSLIKKTPVASLTNAEMQYRTAVFFTYSSTTIASISRFESQVTSMSFERDMTHCVQISICLYSFTP